MKVLLVGEYSGVHNNLKKGLEKLGVKVILINGGDAWKSFGADIKLVEYPENNVERTYNRWCMEFNKIRLKDIDVVQFINPSYFYSIDKYFADLAMELMEKARVSVSLLAGCDANMALHYDKVAPHICPVCLKDGKRCGARCLFRKDRHYQEYEKKFYDKIDAIVPGEWLYYKIYRDYVQIYNDKLKEMILYPVDCEAIKPNFARHRKLVVHHPLNRANKGTALIKKAFWNLRKKYKDEVSFEVCGRMPFRQYLNYLDGIDIMVDGAEGYGPGVGMSSLIAMAKGKAVIGSRVKEMMPDIDNSCFLENPQIAIGSGWDGIADSIENVLKRKNELIMIKKASRKYVENYHDAEKIARKYLDLYRHLLHAGRKEKSCIWKNR